MRDAVTNVMVLEVCTILHARLHDHSGSDRVNPGIKFLDDHAYHSQRLTRLSSLPSTDPSWGMVVPTLRPLLASCPDGYTQAIARATHP